MHIQLTLVLAGLIIGVIVGMTGMGGGALMTPVLVLFFGIPPLAAVSNDLVVSAVMKPIGGLVHLRRGTVDLRLVGLLCAGSVPSAFCGVLVSRALGHGSRVQDLTKTALGIALLLAVAGLVSKAYLTLAERGRRAAARAQAVAAGGTAVAAHDASAAAADAGVVRDPLRPVATVLVGAVGGLIVGMTSVGSGSLIIVALLALYPGLSAAGLVGTDLVQAVPLVASAALGHLIFGDFHLDLTTSLLIGCLPGVYAGARMSAAAPGGVVRRVLAVVLLASALKLFDVGNLATVVTLAVFCVVGPLLWMLARRRQGLPARPRWMQQELAARRQSARPVGPAAAGPAPRPGSR